MSDEDFLDRFFLASRFFDDCFLRLQDQVPFQQPTSTPQTSATCLAWKYLEAKLQCQCSVKILKDRLLQERVCKSCCHVILQTTHSDAESLTTSIQVYEGGFFGDCKRLENEKEAIEAIPLDEAVKEADAEASKKDAKKPLKNFAR